MGTRIVPRSKATTDGAQDPLKAPWTLSASVGRGFDRLTCQYKQSAVTGTPIPVGAMRRSKRITEYMEVAEAHREHARAFSTSVSSAFSAWGASVSASAKYATDAKQSHKSVTALINFEFLAEPYIAFEPTHKDSDAELRPEAKELLAEEGPLKFHETYGTHYVKGYVTGGLMRGHLEAVYETAMHARRASADISIAVTGATKSGSGSASVAEAVSSTEGFARQKVECNTLGWGGSKPPKTDLTIEALLTAKEGFELDVGEKLEAVLGDYRDFPGYQQALAEYEEADGTDVFPEIDLELYKRAAQVLNYEILAAQYIVKRLRTDDHAFPNSRTFNRDVPRYRAAAEVRIEDIKESFCYGADAHENWQAFMEYIDMYRRSDARSDPSAGIQAPTAEELEKFPLATEGFNLSEDLFDNDNLLGKTQKLLRYEVVHSTTVRADWVRSGKDSGGTAEVEGGMRIWWANNTPGQDPEEHGRSEWVKFKRKTHKKMRHFGSRPENLLNKTWDRQHKLPVMMKFYPKEDDGNNNEDDDLGNKTMVVKYGADGPINKYTELRNDTEDTVPHTRHRFGFMFSYEVKRHVNTNVRV